MKENNEKIQANAIINLEIEELETIVAPCCAGAHYPELSISLSK